MSRSHWPRFQAQRDWMGGVRHEANPYAPETESFNEYRREMERLIRREQAIEWEKSHAGV